jgi:hypothetical protein
VIHRARLFLVRGSGRRLPGSSWMTLVFIAAPRD